MIRTICQDQEILSAPSRKAVKKDLRLTRDLVDTMLAYPGCAGIAADINGENIQMLAVKILDEPVVMINPVIVMQKDPYQALEGCLSHPGLETEVTRSFVIEVEYRDRRWKRSRMRLTGVSAQAVQHEMDHFQGILI